MCPPHGCPTPSQRLTDRCVSPDGRRGCWEPPSAWDSASAGLRTGVPRILVALVYLPPYHPSAHTTFAYEHLLEIPGWGFVFNVLLQRKLARMWLSQQARERHQFLALPLD